MEISWSKLIKNTRSPAAIFNLVRNFIFKLYTIRLLNNGERFDPLVSRRFRLSDNSSLSRYIWVAEHLRLSDQVLDIACGTGYGTHLLAGFCRAITGVDGHSQAIDFAKKHYGRGDNIKFIKNDFLFEHQSADVVVSLETIEHLEIEPVKSMDHLWSLAKRLLIVSVPYREPIGHNHHHRHFNLDENSFSNWQTSGQLQFFYQDQVGDIFDYPQPDTQTLLLVLTRK